LKEEQQEIKNNKQYHRKNIGHFALIELYVCAFIYAKLTFL